MIGNYKNYNVCQVDNGLFASLAETIAPHFKKTFYYSPWETAFPKSNQMLTGEGLPGVTRINSIWPLLDEVDLFVFSDIFHGPLQVHLEKLGKRVWGSRLGENFEILRGLQKRWLKDVGLEVGPYRQVRGIESLRDFLKANDDQYVKISRTRGDMETFHSPNYKLIETRIDELESSLGAKKTIADFIVEAPIRPAVEVGYDGYIIDGKFPSKALYGVETKDAAYIGQVVPYDSLPAGIKTVNKKISPMFAEWRYRGFFSSEIRIKNGTPYFIDPTCRQASPPGELMQLMITNLPDVLWEGANGNLVDPEFSDAWGAQLVMRSSWAEKYWQPIEFPKSIRGNVKLHYHTRIEGRDYYIPQDVEVPEIGSVVATGSTPEQAIKNVTKMAEKVEGFDVKFQYDALDKAMADMEKLKAA